MDRIPVELLQTFWDAYLGQCEMEDEPDWRALLSFHRGVLSVSRTWRAVALHTPAIWRNIPLHNQLVAYSRCCLSRSGNHPLNVYASDDKAFRSHIDAERASRILRLGITDKGVLRDWITILLALPITRMHSLSMNSATSSWEKPSQLLGRNPSLRILEITNFFHLPTANVDNPAILPNMRMLKIKDWAQEIEHVLCSISAPSLIHLHLAVNDEHRYGQRNRPMTLIGMTPLAGVKNIAFQFAVVTGDVLAVLFKTPAVEVIHLSHSWNFQDNFGDLFQALSHPRRTDPPGNEWIAPQLHTICLHEFPVSIQTIIECVRARSIVARQWDNPVQGIRTIGVSQRAASAYSPDEISRLRLLAEVVHWTPPHGELR